MSSVQDTKNKTAQEGVSSGSRIVGKRRGLDFASKSSYVLLIEITFLF